MREDRRAAWAGVAAFAWAVLFAAAHVYWAVGGAALLSAAMVDDGRAQWERDPWGYAVSWTILTLLLVGAGLFPLALVWPERWVGRRGMERLAVAAGYSGMAWLIGRGVATGEPALAVLGGGGAALGGAVALVRPRGERVSRWLVLVATWGLGAAMMLDGGAYLLAYVVAGGVSWSLGGALFVATAWRSRRGGRRHNAGVAAVGRASSAGA